MHAHVRPLYSGDPCRLGAYRLLGRVGEGGQARVYLGGAASGRRVAIKALYPRVRADRGGRRRLAAEADALGRILPHFTAELLEARIGATIPYLVTAFIDGPSLYEQICWHGPVGGPMLDELAAGTLTALLTVHAAGLVHHDVKPGNVLLATDGPRLVDFGSSAPVGVRSPGARSRVGVFATPAFMPPELLGPGEITPAADLFSWASTMVFAATGRGPFHARERARMLHRIEHEPPDLAGVPAALLPVLRSCLAKCPDDRPAAEGALDRLLGDLGLHGRPVALPGPPSRPDWRTLTPTWDVTTAPLTLPA